MKKNGFTLVELIAVLVILSILALMATPNIIHLMQSGKENSFISDVEEMVSSATYMYKTQNTRGFEGSAFSYNSATDEYKIFMSSINGTIPDTDPYGYVYQKDVSYITFKEPSESDINGKRIVSAYFKSCKKNDDGSISTKCHCIDASDATNITSDNIEDKDNCNK